MSVALGAMPHRGEAAPLNSGRPVTLDDLEKENAPGRNYVSTLEVSSDGRTLAVAGILGIALLDPSTGNLRRQLGEGVLPHWSPDGTRLAFYSVRSGSMQLWLWNNRDQSLSQLTNVAGGIDPDPLTRMAGFLVSAFEYDWSPDGKMLVLASRVPVGRPVPAAGQPLVLDGDSPPENTLAGVFSHPSAWTSGLAYSPDSRRLSFRAVNGGEQLVSRIQLIDAATGRVTSLGASVETAFYPSWSSDGRSILYAVMPSNDPFSSKSGRIEIRDVSTGQVRIVASDTSLTYQPRWSPDGQSVAFLQGAIDALPKVITVNLNGGSRSMFEPRKHILKLEWQPTSTGFYLSYLDEPKASLGSMELPGGEVQRIASDVQLGWTITKGGSLRGLNGPTGPLLWKISRPGDRPRPAGSLRREDELRDYRRGRSETVSYQNSKGVTLRGVLLYPPSFKAGHRYPLIVDVYPYGAGRDWASSLGGNYAWAEAGYLVFKPFVRSPNAITNCSGEPSFCEAARGPTGWDTAADDVLSGIDVLLRRSLVDPNRMCVFGHSNGGGVAANIITKTARFRCAVVVSPALPNWIGSPLLATTPWKTLSDWAGVSVLDNPEAFVELSAAAFQAKGVKTPVLMAVGDNDGLFLLGAIETYNALRFAGREVCLLRYPNQEHVLEGASLRDFWNREMAFFAYYLRQAGTSAPDDGKATARFDCQAPHS
jgi:dipeptidyl aminopeptidase/acylaminoacyl peptidase